jgi:DNA repair protein RecO (recombination protein O)
VHQKERAICIRKTDYSNSSLILTFFGRGSGKIKLIGKGARNQKSGAGLELFTIGELMYVPPRSGELGTLTTIDIEHNFPALRRKMYSLQFALCAADLLYYFVNDRDSAPELFDESESFFTGLSDGDEAASLRRLIEFQLDMLNYTGHSINISSCTVCHRDFSMDWGRALFSSRLTGLLCPHCAISAGDTFPVALDAIGRLIERGGSLALTDIRKLWYLEKFLLKYICCLLGKEPRSVLSMCRYFEPPQELH